MTQLRLRSLLHLLPVLPLLLALIAIGCAGQTAPATPAATPEPEAPVAAVPPIDPTVDPARGAEPSGEPAATPAASVAAEIAAIVDRSADPCQDFYQYACGGWLAKTPLPADKPIFSRGFTGLADRNRLVLREILEQAGKDPAADAEKKKLGAYYAACMDEAAIEQAGATPLAPLLAEIGRVRDAATLMEVAGKLQRDGVAPLFDIAIEADFKDPGLYIAYLTQGGLGLPDRDYYLKDDEASVALRGEYRDHVARMLVLLGDSTAEAAAQAEEVLAIETELARLSAPRAEMRDPVKLYNRVDRAGLAALTPGLPWDPFFAAANYPQVAALSAAPVDFFKGMAEIARRTEPAKMRAYLRWQTVGSLANRLSKPFVDERFAFFGAKLQGQKQLEPRWERCVQSTDGALGMALGKAFVERQFAGASKEIALEMIRGIEGSFQGGLAGLQWMDDATRARALEKMQAVANKIGYPDSWRDYSALAVTPASHFQNGSAATRFEFDRLLGRVGKTVDRNEWSITPPTVNAFYNPLRNEMVFPAGVLQPPFFEKDFPPPLNYGSIGLAMGHELTHGFDDQGRKFDGSGSLREWWDPSVIAQFEERAKCVSDLYGTFEVEPGLKVNGELTLGENIADLGGIKQAYGAWKAWEAKNGNPGPFVPGFTNDQLFFLGFGQTWCSVTSPEFARMLVTVDPHSPGRFRVNGPAANFPAFAAAFQCKAGTPMNPGKRCEVW